MTTGCYSFRSTVHALRSMYSEYEVPTPHVVFVHRRAEAEEVADAFGFTWVHGGMPDVARAAVAERMRAGDIQVVVCTDVWMTGVDIPNIAAVVLACGGSAPIGLKQRSGRGTRLFGAKEEFLIFDVALKVDDDHQEKRVKGYLDGGYEVEGAVDVVEAAGRIGEDADLAALFSAKTRDARAQAPDVPAPPEPTMWEHQMLVQADTSWRLLPLLILMAVFAVLGHGV